MKKINVLFLSTRAPVPPDTGHFQRTYNTIKQISKFSNVYFCGFYDKGVNKGQDKIINETLLQYCKSVFIEHILDERNIINRIVLTGLGILGRKPYIAKKYYNVKIRNIIRKITKSTKIDLVHLDMLPLAEYSPDLKDIPIVLTEQNVESLRLMRRADEELNNLIKYVLYRQSKKILDYERNVIKSIKHCIVVSEEDKRYLERFNQSCRFYVIPNGVDTEYYSPNNNIEHSGKQILWIGNMADPYNRRGIIYFVREIFEDILESVPSLLWTVVGKEPPNELLELQSLYPDNIKIIGYVEDVRTYYHIADVLVVPLLSGSGTKLKVIEGLGMGMAIVTTPIGAEGIDVVSGQDLVIAKTAEEFSKAVIDLLKNKDERGKIAKKARKVAVEKYDWNIIGCQFKTAYTDMLDIK